MEKNDNVRYGASFPQAMTHLQNLKWMVFIILLKPLSQERENGLSLLENAGESRLKKIMKYFYLYCIVNEQGIITRG